MDFINQINSNTMINFDERVASLRKSNDVINAVVKTVSVKSMDSYVRVYFTLDRDVPCFDENGEKSVTRTIHTSLYSIMAILKENDDACAIASGLDKTPAALEVIFSRAKVELIQQVVPANSTYTNLWTDAECQSTCSYDTIFNHLINVKEFSPKGLKYIEKMEDKKMEEQM